MSIDKGSVFPSHATMRSLSQLPLNDYMHDNSATSASCDVTKPDMEAEEPERGQWGGKLEFILTCVGTAVGLGNVWRFPYLCYKNGGGAFLIPYVIMLILVGLPFFFLELAFGQFANLSPIKIWSISPIFKGLGWSMVLISLIVAIYYNVIIVWCLYYMFGSMTTHLPWIGCDNEWNTPDCSDGLTNAGALNFSSGNTSTLKTPTEEYFYNHVLGISEGIEAPGSIKWNLGGCLVLAWAVVFVVLIRGIQSLGKVVYFTSTIPYILLTIMLIRGVTLPGALDGIYFYLKPDFSKLTEAKVWSDAAVQIFYSLSACMGNLIAMASYNKFNNNCLRDAFLVPIINCCTSVYAGFVIFSVLGFMAYQKGVDVANVAADGPGLVFVVYPEALQHMPVAPLWSVLFFIMMTMLGFSSEFSMAETFLASLIDEYPWLARTPRRNVMYRLVAIAVFFAISLSMVTKGGFYVTNLLDNYVGGIPLLFTGLLEVIILMYIYGYDRFSDDVYLMLGRRPLLYLKLCLCYVSPLILVAIIVFTAVQHEPLTLFESYVYPMWADALGWVLCSAVLCPIVVWALIWAFYHGAWKIIVKESQPSSDWGPAIVSSSSNSMDNKEEEFHYNTGFELEPPPGFQSDEHSLKDGAGKAIYTVGGGGGLHIPRVTVDTRMGGEKNHVGASPH